MTPHLSHVMYQAIVHLSGVLTRLTIPSPQRCVQCRVPLAVFTDRMLGETLPFLLGANERRGPSAARDNASLDPSHDAELAEAVIPPLGSLTFIDRVGHHSALRWRGGEGLPVGEPLVLNN